MQRYSCQARILQKNTKRSTTQAGDRRISLPCLAASLLPAATRVSTGSTRRVSAAAPLAEGSAHAESAAQQRERGQGDIHM